MVQFPPTLDEPVQGVKKRCLFFIAVLYFGAMLSVLALSERVIFSPYVSSLPTWVIAKPGFQARTITSTRVWLNAYGPFTVRLGSETIDAERLGERAYALQFDLEPEVDLELVSATANAEVIFASSERTQYWPAWYAPIRVAYIVGVLALILAVYAHLLL